MAGGGDAIRYCAVRVHGCTGSRAAGRANDERGQATLMIVFLFPALFVLGFLAVSVSMIVAGKASAQRAADAAALAGCLSLGPNSSDVTNAQNAAIQYGASSGGKNASATANLESGDGNQILNPSPPVVDNSGAVGANGQPLKNNRITVVVQRSQPLLGPSSWNFTNQTIKAKAVCKRKEGGVAVILVLDPTAKDALKLQGQFNVDLGTLGGVVVDSTNSTGLDINGGASIEAQYINVGSSPPAYALCGSCSVTPGPSTGTAPDPFASVPEPAAPSPSTPEAVAGCSGTASSPSMCTITSGSIPCQASGVDVFWGGLTLSGTVTLSPCIYYLAGGGNRAGNGGGGLNISPGTTVTETAPGVMFFNGQDPSGGGKKGCGGILIQNSVNLQLAPPQSGTYQELLFFQSRSCGAAAIVEAGVTLGLNPTSGNVPCGGLVCGALYAAGCPTCSPAVTPMVNIGPQAVGQGGGQDFINVPVIADMVNITGQLTFNNPFIPSGTVNNGDIALSPCDDFSC